MNLKILYNDKYFIAVEKPAGLNTEPDSKGNSNLVDELRKLLSKKHPIKFGPAVVHRLDRPVSGIVLFALTPMALKKINKLFEQRKVRKLYQTIVCGHPLVKKQKLQHFLFKDTLQKKAVISFEATENYMPVSLSFKVLEFYENTSKLEIELHSGKYHQIRAQLSAIGHPIMGDVLYGGPSLTLEHKILLHATLLQFKHPITFQEITITSTPDF